MRLFEKIYPQSIEQKRFYYSGGLFFDMSDCSTNIPRKDQRFYRVPATNPDYAGKSLSVKTHIRLRAEIRKSGLFFTPFIFPGRPDYSTYKSSKDM